MKRSVFAAVILVVLAPVGLTADPAAAREPDQVFSGVASGEFLSLDISSPSVPGAEIDGLQLVVARSEAESFPESRSRSLSANSARAIPGYDDPTRY